MDGLELIRRAKALQADLGVLVLSCLDDFSYVKEAMKLGARDYILKPTMEPEELVKVLNHIGDQLMNERKQLEHLRQLNIQLKQSKSYQLESKIRRFMELALVDEHLEQELFTDDKWLYSMLLCSNDGKALAPFNNHYESTYLVSIETNYNERLVLIEQQKHSDVNDLIELSTIRAEQYLSWMSSIDESSSHAIYMGPLIEGMDQLRLRLDFHRSQMHYRFYANSDSTSQIVREASLLIPTDFPMALEIRNDILKSVMGNNREGVKHHTKRLAIAIHNHQPDLVRLHAFIFETIGLMIGYARDKNYAGIELYEQQYLTMERIKSNLHIDCLMEWVEEAIFEYWNCSTMDTTHLSVSNHPFIRKAKEYMKLNYQKSIGTTDIADHVRLSRSYLSDLYSREVGESLIETLTRIRIEEACKRLKLADQKIYEIAEEVGFADSKTFARTFRRIVGCSPKEYEGSNK